MQVDEWLKIHGYHEGSHQKPGAFKHSGFPLSLSTDQKKKI